MSAHESPDEHDARIRDAFLLLADETRLDIIETLRHAENSPLSYGTLKNALAIRDSGRFNYHLDKLTGTFVSKTEDGYALSSSASALYQAVLSTRPIAEHPSPTFDIAEPCPECGASFEICYKYEWIVSHCPNCESQRFAYPFPAGAFAGRTDREALEAVIQRMYHHISLAQQGVCPYCSGTMTAEWLTDHDTAFPTAVLVRYTCLLCGMELHTSVAAMIKQHSPIVSLFDDYGIDLRETPPWEFRRYVPRDGVTVRSASPVRIEISVRIEGDVFTVFVDECMEISSIESEHTRKRSCESGTNGSVDQ